MGHYQYRFVVIYWVTYLEEFEQSCSEYLRQRLNKVADFSELYKPESYNLYCKYFEIPATSAIFHDKLGKHPETKTIFEVLGFERVPPGDDDFVKCYRIRKDKENRAKVQ